MPINGYFDTVFATSGSVTPVPDGAQGNGSVSYTEGYGILYSTPVGSGGFNFPRAQHNQVLFDITTAIQNWQQNTIAPFITTTMNGGTPYVYPQYAMVLYGGVAYISNTGSNSDIPPTSKWTILGTAAAGTLTGNTLASGVVTASITQFGGAGGIDHWNFVYSNSGSDANIGVLNNHTAAGTTAGAYYFTGTTNAYSGIYQADGTDLATHIVSGAGNTNGMNISTGAGPLAFNAANGSITFNGGALSNAIWHGTAIAGATYVTAILGAWASKSTGTIYQAATDGFVVGTSSGSNSLQMITDSSSTPTTVRQYAGNDAAGSARGTIMCPVKKNDYWEVVGTSDALFWIPMGA
jgi:hypothetical protein